MNWNHIHLIFMRELRDQMRDRRTLFTIAVLPLLLYPLMGMMMLQVAQFNREHPVRMTLVGMEHWSRDLPLTRDGKFNQQILPENDSRLIELSHETYIHPAQTSLSNEEKAKTQLEAGQTDLVLIVDPDFDSKLASLKTSGESPSELLSAEGQAESGTQALLRILGNHSSDQSQIAIHRLRDILDTWQRLWVAKQLEDAHIQPSMIQPLQLKQIDISPPARRNALVWSKLLPFVMLIWALTGAFYPAVDLCAGEKERGTLETLLVSPARRREIVWGKLLTVMSFSVCTALLNLISMQLTASFVMNQFARLGSGDAALALGPLPINSIGWLVMMLLPMSALFSALALAVAALARSSKEGQYYLMPLLLVGMPLVILPMLPGMELTIGTSVVPVTGAVLLSRSLIEGQYREAVLHLPFVLCVTVLCCLLAVRWAVRQFESESVMFRESERFDISTWLRHVWRDRGETASSSEAILCGLIILVALFFGRMMASETTLDWNALARSTWVIQVGLIATPCLIMATMLTRSIRIAFRVNATHLSDLLVSGMLAICLHPTYVLLAGWVQQEYALGADTKALLQQLDSMISAVPLTSVIFFLALVPAICEELAFRGFLFGGLEQQKGTLRAILLSSLFFGLSHGVLQQSISATVMGLVLGVIAWRTGGVLCGMVFHLTHNTLTMWLARAARNQELPSWMDWGFVYMPNDWCYSATWTTLSIALSLMGFAWFFLPKRDQAFKWRWSPLYSRKIDTSL